MKSEEFILQELEKDRLQKEKQERAVQGVEEEEEEEEEEKPVIKFMISGEAPILMSKACELLIKELSFRAWRHTERNRRRTLQRQDLHAAVGESEVYDFLIDIVPRVTTTSGSSQKTQNTTHPPPLPPTVPPGLGGTTNATSMASTGINPSMQLHGMHSGLPTAAAAAAMQGTHGPPVDSSAMMQHVESQQQQQQQQQQHQQHSQLPQQHQQYHHDPSHQLTSQPQQHILQQQQYHHQQPATTQQQHAFASGGVPQDGTQRGSSPLWLQHPVSGGQTAGHAASHP